jgi:hypothetical protein
MEKNSQYNELECVMESHLFDGYTQFINIQDVQSIEEIIGIVISTLYSLFHQYNMIGLIDHLSQLSFHIEKVTFDDILKGRISKIKIVEDEYDDSDNEDSQ